MLRLLAATALFLSATTGAFATCPGEGVYRSIESSHPTVLTFVNAAQSAEDMFAVYWLDFNGQRQHYGDVFPGQALRLETFVTHPWVVAFAEPGGGELCYHIYLPDPEPATVTIN